MSEEEILRYILSCVSYKHMFDLSPQITESAKKKEDLLFSSAVFFLRELGKGKNVFAEDIEKEKIMKEVTYEDWLRNPTPRMMWVWDNDVEKKEKQKVVYVLNNSCTYRVLSIVGADFSFDTFQHCAEIEKQRRMTQVEE